MADTEMKNGDVEGGSPRDGQAGGAEQVQWDEEQIEEALNALNDMYTQLRGLRSTIPRLMAPLSTKQPSPAILFQKVTAAAVTANAEVKQFRELMEADESKKIFGHVRESRAQDSKGITPWRITEHPGWCKKDS